MTIPSVLLSGPHKTLAYIRQLTPEESLLDDVWAEGGVLVNVDTHSALFWGGESIAQHQYLRRPLLATLRVLPLEVQQGMQYGKGFFSADAPLLSPQERREVFEQVLLRMSENDGLPGTN